MATISRKIQIHTLRSSLTALAHRNPLNTHSLSPFHSIDSEQSRIDGEALPASEECKLKADKDSTSPLTHSVVPPLAHPSDLFRPVTRSSSGKSTWLSSEPYLLTPQQPSLPISQLLPPMPSNTGKAASWLQIPTDSQYDITLNLKRTWSKGSEGVASPFGEYRKSYRKTQRTEIASIPYRKCHDAFEGRIVCILNKIVSGKNCFKDLQGLVQKIARMTHKDMSNRFIVGGIASLIALADDQRVCDSKILAKLKQEFQRLQEKIEDFYSSYDQFLVEKQESNKDEDILAENEWKTELTRRAYSIAKQNCPNEDRGTLRRRVVQECEGFFKGNATIGAAIALLKKYLACRDH